MLANEIAAFIVAVKLYQRNDIMMCCFSSSNITVHYVWLCVGSGVRLSEALFCALLLLLMHCGKMCALCYRP